MTLPVVCVVEGRTDQPAVLRLMEETGLPRHGPTRIAEGKGNIDRELAGWNAKAMRLPWVVIRDLDQDDRGTCLPELRSRLLGGTGPSDGMCFRLAVRSIEAWLMADHEGFVDHFGPRSRPPDDVDGIPDPKRTLMDLCRSSHKRDIREGVPPRKGSGRRHGPAYVDIVADYCQSVWSPAQARRRSLSLDRALRDMVRLRDWL